MGLWKMSSAAVSSAARKSKSVMQLPMVLSALSLSPRPMKMEARGAPPMLASAAKALTSKITGMQAPTPASASVPMPSRRPMYMRSTML